MLTSEYTCGQRTLESVLGSIRPFQAVDLLQANHLKLTLDIRGTPASRAPWNLSPSQQRCQGRDGTMLVGCAPINHPLRKPSSKNRSLRDCGSSTSQSDSSDPHRTQERLAVSCQQSCTWSGRPQGSCSMIRALCTVCQDRFKKISM